MSPVITFHACLQLHVKVQRLLSSSELSEPQSGSASRAAKQTSFPAKHAALPWLWMAMGSPQPLLLLPLVLSDSVDEWNPELEHETSVPTASHVTHEIYCPMISYDHLCILMPPFNLIHSRCKASCVDCD